MNIKLLKRIAGLIKPLTKLKGFLGKILPKRKESREIEELREEIETLKQQINKTEKKAVEVITKEVKNFFQAEMYIKTVKSGEIGSGDVYFWLINTNDENTINVFFELPVSKIKRKLGIPKNVIVNQIEKGMTTAQENIFFEKTSNNGKKIYKSNEELERAF